MSDPVRTALITVLMSGLLSGLFALVLYLFNSNFQKAQRLAEERRWYAEFYLKPRVEALQAAITALTDCRYTFDFYTFASPPNDATYMKEVFMRLVTLERATAVATAYLPPEKRSRLQTARATVSHLAVLIYDRNFPAASTSSPGIPPLQEVLDSALRDLKEACNKAIQDLMVELNPSALVQLTGLHS